MTLLLAAALWFAGNLILAAIRWHASVDRTPAINRHPSTRRPTRTRTNLRLIHGHRPALYDYDRDQSDAS